MCAFLGLLFLVIPAVEIAVIIKVGSFLGFWPTLGIIGVTAMLGAALAKSQGLAVYTELQKSVQEGKGTALAIAEGVFILVAGVTLLAPGFITDIVGLALLVPMIRKPLAKNLVGKVQLTGPITRMQPKTSSENDPPPPGVIDI